LKQSFLNWSKIKMVVDKFLKIEMVVYKFEKIKMVVFILFQSRWSFKFA